LKKKLKIFLLILLIVILATAGALLYFFKFKEYDVADEEVTKIIEDPYTLELPDGTTITLDENGDIVESAGNAPTPGTEGTSSDGTSTEDSNTDGTATDTTKVEGTTSDTTKVEGTTTPDKKVPAATTGNNSTTTDSPKSTVSTIKQKYIPTIENLESQAETKLNTLVSHAKTEYTTKKANGESISYAYFYNKYAGAAEGLEAKTDAVFKGVIKAVEKDLVTNGYDKSYAQNLVDEYNAAKKARKNSLLSKVTGL